MTSVGLCVGSVKSLLAVLTGCMSATVSVHAQNALWLLVECNVSAAVMLARPARH